MKLVYCLPIRYPNDAPVGEFDRCLMAPMRKESAYRLAYYRVEANMHVVHVVSLLVLNMSSCSYSSKLAIFIPLNASSNMHFFVP